MVRADRHLRDDADAVLVAHTLGRVRSLGRVIGQQRYEEVVLRRARRVGDEHANLAEVARVAERTDARELVVLRLSADGHILVEVFDDYARLVGRLDYHVLLHDRHIPVCVAAEVEAVVYADIRVVEVYLDVLVLIHIKAPLDAVLRSGSTAVSCRELIVFGDLDPARGKVARAVAVHRQIVVDIAVLDGGVHHQRVVVLDAGANRNGAVGGGAVAELIASVVAARPDRAVALDKRGGVAAHRDIAHAVEGVVILVVVALDIRRDRIAVARVVYARALVAALALQRATAVHAGGGRVGRVDDRSLLGAVAYLAVAVAAPHPCLEVERVVVALLIAAGASAIVGIDVGAVRRVENARAVGVRYELRDLGYVEHRVLALEHSGVVRTEAGVRVGAHAGAVAQLAVVVRAPAYHAAGGGDVHRRGRRCRGGRGGRGLGIAVDGVVRKQDGVGRRVGRSGRVGRGGRGSRGSRSGRGVVLQLVGESYDVAVARLEGQDVLEVEALGVLGERLIFHRVRVGYVLAYAVRVGDKTRVVLALDVYLVAVAGGKQLVLVVRAVVAVTVHAAYDEQTAVLAQQVHLVIADDYVDDVGYVLVLALERRAVLVYRRGAEASAYRGPAERSRKRRIAALLAEYVRAGRPHLTAGQVERSHRLSARRDAVDAAQSRLGHAASVGGVDIAVACEYHRAVAAGGYLDALAVSEVQAHRLRVARAVAPSKDRAVHPQTNAEVVRRRDLRIGHRLGSVGDAAVGIVCRVVAQLERDFADHDPQLEGVSGKYITDSNRSLAKSARLNLYPVIRAVYRHDRHRLVGAYDIQTLGVGRGAAIAGITAEVERVVVLLVYVGDVYVVGSLALAQRTRHGHAQRRVVVVPVAKGGRLERDVAVQVHLVVALGQNKVVVRDRAGGGVPAVHLGFLIAVAVGRHGVAEDYRVGSVGGRPVVLAPVVVTADIDLARAVHEYRVLAARAYRHRGQVILRVPALNEAGARAVDLVSGLRADEVAAAGVGAAHDLGGEMLLRTFGADIVDERYRVVDGRDRVVAAHDEHRDRGHIRAVVVLKMLLAGVRADVVVAGRALADVQRGVRLAARAVVYRVGAYAEASLVGVAPCVERVAARADEYVPSARRKLDDVRVGVAERLEVHLLRQGVDEYFVDSLFGVAERALRKLTVGVVAPHIERAVAHQRRDIRVTRVDCRDFAQIVGLDVGFARADYLRIGVVAAAAHRADAQLSGVVAAPCEHAAVRAQCRDKSVARRDLGHELKSDIADRHRAGVLHLVVVVLAVNELRRRIVGGVAHAQLSVVVETPRVDLVELGDRVGGVGARRDAYDASVVVHVLLRAHAEQRDALRGEQRAARAAELSVDVRAEGVDVAEVTERHEVYAARVHVDYLLALLQLGEADEVRILVGELVRAVAVGVERTPDPDGAVRLERHVRVLGGIDHRLGVVQLEVGRDDYDLVGRLVVLILLAQRDVYLAERLAGRDEVPALRIDVILEVGDDRVGRGVLYLERVDKRTLPRRSEQVEARVEALVYAVDTAGGALDDVQPFLVGYGDGGEHLLVEGALAGVGVELVVCLVIGALIDVRVLYDKRVEAAVSGLGRNVAVRVGVVRALRLLVASGEPQAALVEYQLQRVLVRA